MISAEDRIALLLGRAIMRAEALHVENEQLRTQLAQHAKPKQEKKRGK